MAEVLIIFGWVAVIFFIAAVVIPYLRGTNDLMNSWALFIIGAANFIGYDAVLSGRGVFSYGLFTTEQYLKLMLGLVVYTAALFAAYYGLKFPRRLAGRTFLRWPEYRGPSGLFIIALCLFFLTVSVFFPNVQFLGQILIIIGPPAGVVAICVAFFRWWDNRLSAATLAMVAALVIVALVASVHGTTGRRSMLSVVLAIPACVYFLWLRYRSLGWSAVPLMGLAAATVIVLAAYTSIRHRYNMEIVNVTGRTPLQTAIESVRMLPEAIVRLEGLDNIFGSGAIEASLVAISWYPDSAAHEPFFVIRYMLANPIPRAFWPDKPEALGETLPRDTGVWERTGYVNWGPGVVGHGFHEGGYFFIAFYAVLAGVVMRYFDELLKRQPNNPYLVGLLAGASGQIIAYTRGDIGLFGMLIIGAIIPVVLIRWIAGMFFGLRLVFPSDEQRQLAEAAAAAGAQGASPQGEPGLGWDGDGLSPVPPPAPGRWPGAAPPAPVGP